MDSSVSSIPPLLDMGIHDDAGTVWLPKALYPERNKAKLFVSAEFANGDYINLRCHSVYMRPATTGTDGMFEKCDATDDGAFACWEIT